MFLCFFLVNCLLIHLRLVVSWSLEFQNQIRQSFSDDGHVWFELGSWSARRISLHGRLCLWCWWFRRRCLRLWIRTSCRGSYQDLWILVLTTRVPCRLRQSRQLSWKKTTQPIEDLSLPPRADTKSKLTVAALLLISVFFLYNWVCSCVTGCGSQRFLSGMIIVIIIIVNIPS
ncbi:hypothetical protein BJX70DRAFT_251774 [Aspergillus crustosus]